MSEEVKIEFISEGFKQILLSEGVHDVIQSATDQIATRANAEIGSDGYDSDVVQSPRMSGYGNGGRWVGFVRATDREAMVAEAEDKTLSRAVTG